MRLHSAHGKIVVFQFHSLFLCVFSVSRPKPSNSADRSPSRKLGTSPFACAGLGRRSAFCPRQAIDQILLFIFPRPRVFMHAALQFCAARIKTRRITRPLSRVSPAARASSRRAALWFCLVVFSSFRCPKRTNSAAGMGEGCVLTPGKRQPAVLPEAAPLPILSRCGSHGVCVKK